MNPSTSGWIEKFLREFDNDQYNTKWSINTLYSDLKEVGFIYGNSIETIIPNTSGMVYSEEEKTKINLFAALVLIYYDTIKNANREDCINAIVQFYNFMDTKKSFFLFSNVLPTNKTEKLEKIIHTRIQTNESIFKKNFSHLLTNALLFIDVLAFDYFLVYSKNPFEYAAKFEETVTNTVFLALNSKEKQNEHDKLLIKLFASSVRYTDISIENTSFDYIELDPYTDILEKKYILDLTSMAVWNDQVLDQGEQSFMMALGEELQIPEADVQYSINTNHQNRKDINFKK